MGLKMFVVPQILDIIRLDKIMDIVLISTRPPSGAMVMAFDLNPRGSHIPSFQ